MKRIHASVLCAFVILVVPATSFADWVVMPFVGSGFGGAIHDAPRVPFGASVGWMGDRGWGFEVEVSRQPNFFSTPDVPDVIFGGSSGVTTAMVNGVVGLPSGRWAERFRPFVAAGIGLFRSQIGSDESFIRRRSNNLGFNVGGGTTVRLTDAFGVRGDIRYFRDAQDFDGESEFFNLADSTIDFWRATVGVTFGF